MREPLLKEEQEEQEKQQVYKKLEVFIKWQRVRRIFHL